MKKNNPLITVVIPCYHVEDVIGCIFSDLKKQSFSDFEMVFVNDGGGEKMSTILGVFAENDDRVIKVEKSNGGASSARNAGLKIAHGEWVVFVDPDDRVEPYYLQCLYDSVAGTKSYVGIGGFRQKDVRSGELQDFRMKENKKEVHLAKCYHTFYGYQASVLWNKIYNVDFLRKNNLYLDETITFAEDLDFNLCVFQIIETIGVCADCGYWYIVAGTSATNRYHAHLAEYLRKTDRKNFELLRKFGISDIELHTKAIRQSKNRAFFLVVNCFKSGNGMNLQQKVKKISDDVLQDKILMDNLMSDKCKYGLKIDICAFFIVNRQIWMLVIFFAFLYKIKYVIEKFQ